MVKGLSSPETSHVDLMRTYNASKTQTFWKLRLPTSLPYLFTSMKVAVAISLVGAIVAELPTGAVAGLGARQWVVPTMGKLSKSGQLWWSH